YSNVGPGRPHRFTPQQALGFAVHGDLIECTRAASGCGLNGGKLVIAALMKSWEQISDEKLLQWVRDSKPDAWRDQAVPQAALVDALTPPEVEVPEETGRRFVRTWEEIKRRVNDPNAARGPSRGAARRLAKVGG